MITSKQRAYLRALSQNLPDSVLLGKEGMSEAAARQMDEFITVHEILKVKLLPSCAQSVEECARIACDALGGEPVSRVGRKFVVYRRNPKEQRIFLPR